MRAIENKKGIIICSIIAAISVVISFIAFYETHVFTFIFSFGGVAACCLFAFAFMVGMFSDFTDKHLEKVIMTLIILCVIVSIIVTCIAGPDSDSGSGGGSYSDDKCAMCDGAGMINDGFLDFKTCPVCRGSGIPPI